MSVNKSHSIDMLHGSLLKSILAFSIPVTLTSLLQMCFNQADMMVVGQFAGSNALAAVGATGSLCFMMIALFGGLATGANVVIAQYIGSGNKQMASKAVHTSILLSAVCGIFMTIVGVLLARPILEFMKTPEEIIDQSTLYMRIYFGGIFFLMMYNTGAAVLRSKGDTKRPLYFLALAGVLNVALNLFCVIVLHWGVAGVATATAVSNAVATVLIIIALLKETDSTKLILRELKFTGSILANILKIGVPAGIQGMMFALSNVIIQSSLNSFNDANIVAANTAGANLENFVYIGMNFCQATITFISQNMGAKKYDRVGKITRVTLGLDIAGAGIIGTVVWVFGRFFLSFYVPDNPAVIELAMDRMTWVALFLFLNGILDVYVNALRGMGYSLAPTIMMISGICGVRILWLYTVFAYVGTLESIYWCFPVSWLFTSVITGAMYYVKYAKLRKSQIA